MGQHRQALEIYVFKLQDPEKAEECVFLIPSFLLSFYVKNHAG
jgi:hypothetical protein